MSVTIDNFRDYYQVLKIDRTATAEDIRRSYRFLETHYRQVADTNREASGDALYQLQQIQRAYTILGEEKERSRYNAQYDFRGSFGLSETGAQDPAQRVYEAGRRYIPLLESFDGGEPDGAWARNRDRAIWLLKQTVVRWPESPWAVRAQFDVVQLLMDTRKPLFDRARVEAECLARLAAGTVYYDEAVRVIALSHAGQGDVPQAIQVLTALEARMTDPEDHALLLYLLATLQERIGQDAAAAEHYRRSLTAADQHTYCVEARYRRAFLLDKLHRSSEALAAYREALDTHPDMPESTQCRERILALTPVPQKSLLANLTRLFRRPCAEA